MPWKIKTHTSPAGFKRLCVTDGAISEEIVVFSPGQEIDKDSIRKARDRRDELNEDEERRMAEPASEVADEVEVTPIVKRGPGPRPKKKRTIKSKTTE